MEEIVNEKAQSLEWTSLSFHFYLGQLKWSREWALELVFSLDPCIPN